MPVTWSISHAERLVVAVAGEETTRQDVERYWAEIAAAGGMPYAKLFDAKHAIGSFDMADLRSLGKTMTDYARQGPVGPIAIVVGGEAELEMAKVFGEAAGNIDRAFRIFGEVPEARQWLLDLAAPGAPLAAH